MEKVKETRPLVSQLHSEARPIPFERIDVGKISEDMMGGIGPNPREKEILAIRILKGMRVDLEVDG